MAIDKKLDDIWSKLVKQKWGLKCSYCGSKNNLESHHIFSRSKLSVRWDTENGICLCKNHHTLSSNFSAHGTPEKFDEWLEMVLGFDFKYKLRQKSNEINKMMLFEKQELFVKLKNELENE